MAFFSTLQAETDSRPAALDGAYLMPAMAIIATAMVTGTFSPGFDRYYAARVIAATAAFFLYRGSYTELRLKWSWQAVAIGCGVFALWIAMEPYGSTASSGTPIRSGLESLSQGWATAWLIFRVVGSVLMVPLAEELAFRGYLTRRLISADFQAIPPGQLTWWSLLHFIPRLRGAPRSLGRRHAGRDGVCDGVSPPRRADRCRPGPRRDQRADRDHRTDDGVLVSLVVIRLLLKPERNIDAVKSCTNLHPVQAGQSKKSPLKTALVPPMPLNWMITLPVISHWR